jgi:hypothetical protein
MIILNALEKSSTVLDLTHKTDFAAKNLFYSYLNIMFINFLLTKSNKSAIIYLTTKIHLSMN